MHGRTMWILEVVVREIGEESRRYHIAIWFAGLAVARRSDTVVGGVLDEGSLGKKKQISMKYFSMMGVCKILSGLNQLTRKM